MTLTRKIVLRDAPPLVGTEIAVYINGKATDRHDGFTFVIARIVDFVVVRTGRSRDGYIADSIAQPDSIQTRPCIGMRQIRDRLISNFR